MVTKEILEKEFFLKIEIVKQWLLFQRLTDSKNKLVEEIETVERIQKILYGEEERTESESLAQKKNKKKQIELALAANQKELRTRQAELEKLGAEINQDWTKESLEQKISEYERLEAVFSARKENISLFNPLRGIEMKEEPWRDYEISKKSLLNFFRSEINHTEEEEIGIIELNQIENLTEQSLLYWQEMKID